MHINIISQANNVHEYSQNSKLEYHNVEYPEVFVLSRNLSRFFFVIGETREDEFWKERKRRLKRLVFLFASAPLSKDYLRNYLNEAIIFFEQDIIYCEKLYPSLSGRYKTLLEDIKTIEDTELDVIKKSVDRVVNLSEGSTAILIKATKIIPTIEEYYNNQNVQIVSINSLRSMTTYDNIVIVGPTSDKWFPDFIFSSPRAKNIHIVKFQWLKGSWQPKAVFPNPIVSSNKKELYLEANTIPGTHEEYIDPDVLLPTIDFSSIITNTWKEVEEESEAEFVEAIIGHLENDQIVFLDYDDSSTVRIIDVEDEETPVKKIRVKELTADMFLLLKTSGGGDYIVPLADRILGNQSVKLRNTQKYWKDRLRKTKFEKGTNCLINELVDKGCSIANPTNLQNWMSYRSIKTSRFSHFKAIIEVIDIKENAQDIWQQMRVINQAHIKAGRHVTKLLLNIAREADLEELMRLGIMEFELPDKDAGTITAFRIRALSDRHETVLVSPTKIGIPVDIE